MPLRRKSFTFVLCLCTQVWWQSEGCYGFIASFIMASSGKSNGPLTDKPTHLSTTVPPSPLPLSLFPSTFLFFPPSLPLSSSRLISSHPISPLFSSFHNPQFFSHLLTHDPKPPIFHRGYVNTAVIGMVEEVTQQPPPLERVALQRLATPDEIARLIVFLLSEESSYVTGAVWTCDGGLTC